MKTITLTIGGDALKLIERSLTVARLTHSGGVDVFSELAKRVAAAENGEAVKLLTKTDKQADEATA
jgi:hypothetical protein